MRYLAIIATAFLFCLSQTIWAQKGKQPKLQEATKTALQEHYTTKVYPTKKGIHDDLMLQLSESERSLLEAQRGAYQALQEEQRQVMRQLRKERQESSTTTDRKTAMAPFREKRQEILKAVLPIVENHQETIKQAMSELKEHHAEWKTDRKAILTQYESAEMVEQLEKRQSKRKEKRQERRQNSDTQPQKGVKAAHFLLWDGQPRTPKGSDR